MEQVSGEVHQKEEGLKTLERVDQKLSTNTPPPVSERETQCGNKQAVYKEKDNLLNTKVDTKLVSFLYSCGYSLSQVGMITDSGGQIYLNLCAESKKNA